MNKRKKLVTGAVAGAATLAALLLCYRCEPLKERIATTVSPKSVCEPGQNCAPVAAAGDKICHPGEDNPASNSYVDSDCPRCGNGVNERKTNRYSEPHLEQGIMVRDIAGEGGETENKANCEADSSCGDGAVTSAKVVAMWLPDMSQSKEAARPLVHVPAVLREVCDGEPGSWDVSFRPDYPIPYQVTHHCIADCQAIAKAEEPEPNIEPPRRPAVPGKIESPVSEGEAEEEEAPIRADPCPDIIISASLSGRARRIMENITDVIHDNNDYLWYSLAHADTKSISIHVRMNVDAKGVLSLQDVYPVCDTECKQSDAILRYLGLLQQIGGEKLDSPSESCPFTKKVILRKPKELPK